MRSLKLNKSMCSIIAIDKTKIVPPTFNLLSDINRKDSLIGLDQLLLNEGVSEEKIKRRVRLTNLLKYGRIMISEKERNCIQ